MNLDTLKQMSLFKSKDLDDIVETELLINYAGHVGEINLNYVHEIKEVETLSSSQYQLTLTGFFDCSYLQSSGKKNETKR